MNPKIIIFNGPPGSGKDTAAEFFNKRKGVKIFNYKMALPLKEACHKLLGLNISLQESEGLKEKDIKFPINRHANLFPEYEFKKDVLTLRDFYIHISENVMKPLFGKYVFGRIGVENIKANMPCDYVIISDCGFKEEIQSIIDEFGTENVKLVRIHRVNKTFSNDSRAYMYNDKLEQIDISNNETLEDFENKIKKLNFLC